MFFQQKFSLADYGEEFKDSYLIFKMLDKNQAIKSFKQVAKLQKAVEKADATVEQITEATEALYNVQYELVKKQFIKGSVWDGEAQRDAKPSDIDSLPTNIIGEINSAIRGTNSKKS